MIENPKLDIGRTIWRAVFESAAQFTPVTAALSRLYQTTHPSQFERELVVWREQITLSANESEKRLSALEADLRPTIRLSPLATEAALWLATKSEFGRSGSSISLDDIRSAFSSQKVSLIEEALSELKDYGLVELTGKLGASIFLVVPQPILFWMFDPAATGNSPQDDALLLAKLFLERTSVNIAQLAGELGWSPRRLNPALSLVITVTGTGLVSREVSREFVATYLRVGAHERMRLRRLLEATAPAAA